LDILALQKVTSGRPPARLEAVRNRLQAMLQAIETIQPALVGFYDVLNDDQKARFNTMGKQLLPRITCELLPVAFPSSAVHRRLALSMARGHVG
jgi:LTXXQ motif family protein